MFSTAGRPGRPKPCHALALRCLAKGHLGWHHALAGHSTHLYNDAQSSPTCLILAPQADLVERLAELLKQTPSYTCRQTAATEQACTDLRQYLHARWGRIRGGLVAPPPSRPARPVTVSACQVGGSAFYAAQPTKFPETFKDVCMPGHLQCAGMERQSRQPAESCLRCQVQSEARWGCTSGLLP